MRDDLTADQLEEWEIYKAEFKGSGLTDKEIEEAFEDYISEPNQDPQKKNTTAIVVYAILILIIVMLFKGC